MTEGREFLLETRRAQQSGIVRVCAMLWRVRRKARIHAGGVRVPRQRRERVDS